MKKCFSLGTWVDLTDGHEYKVGDIFPHDGRNIPAERLKQLSTLENNTGNPLVFIVDDEELVQKEEPVKTAEKSRKNEA